MKIKLTITNSMKKMVFFKWKWNKRFLQWINHRPTLTLLFTDMFAYLWFSLDRKPTKGVTRSTSNKQNKEGGANIRRAISFRHRQDGELSAAPVLQKAKEFREGVGVVTPPPTPEGPAPDLPSAPPPEMSMGATSPISKKGQLSPPVSPKQKHLEHLKDEKKKRTPSFNLRRRTRSFKDKHRLPENLPPAEMEGPLERKQELQSGGKKATIRSWKNYYAVLFGQLLCFFKDKEGIKCLLVRKCNKKMDACLGRVIT